MDIAKLETARKESRRRIVSNRRTSVSRRTRLTAAFLSLASVTSLAVTNVGAVAVATRATSSQELSTTNQPPVQQVTGLNCTTTTPGTGGCDIWAKTGTVTAGSAQLPIWGYATTADGAATIPGPTIVARNGDVVRVTLHNTLSVDTSLSFPAANVDDFTSAATRDGTAAASNGVMTYEFTVNGAGTSIYEAGPNTPTGNRQVAMGLSGVLIARPATSSCPTSTSPKLCLYGDPNSGGNGTSGRNAGTDVADDEALVALNDIDPAFNANPLGFDMGTFAPMYHLINGKAFPATDVIDTQAGHTLAVRFANLSPIAHTMGLIGARQDIVGRDAHALPHGRSMVSPLLTPGETMDTTVAVPTDAPPGQRFALYDQGRRLHNGVEDGYGGALTFINVWAVAGAPAQPVADLGALEIGDPASDITDGSTSFNFQGSTPGNVIGRWFIDKMPADPTTMPPINPGSGDRVLGTVSKTMLDGLDNGSHVIWVQLSDDNGTSWGSPVGVAFTLDRSGPVMSGTSLVPAVTNGTSPVILRTTADTTKTGTANISLGKYAVDSTCSAAQTSPNNLDPDPTLLGAPTQAFATTLTSTALSGLAEGIHTFQVTAQDALGHWPKSNPSANPPNAPLCDETSLLVDKTPPAILTGATIDPNPNDGTQTTQGNTNFLDSLRVTATAKDGLSNVVKVEAFLDGNYADSSGHQLTLPGGAVTGQGFEFHPTDGSWNALEKQVYAYIPLATVRALSPGLHGIWIHAQDAAGNWGPLSQNPDAVLNYAPQAPTINYFTVNGTTLNVGATAAIVGLNVTALEYSIGSTPAAPGGGTAISITPGRVVTATATIGSRSATQNVFVRAQDSRGTWSAAVGLPTVGNANYAAGSSTLSATALSSTGDMTAVQFVFGPANGTTAPTTGWADLPASSGTSPLTVTAPQLPAPTTPRILWLRASDVQGNIGPATPLPTASATVNNGTLSGVATSPAADIAGVEFVRGPANSTSVPGTGWTAVANSAGASPKSYSIAVSGGSSNATRGYVWVRVRDSSGNYGPAVRA